VLAVHLSEEPADHGTTYAAKCGLERCGRGSMTVTSQPYSRAAAAVSNPIQPATDDDHPAAAGCRSR
jgi:hypothetical protein